MKEFVDKVAVVTGAASGIGKALAERLAVRGMKIVVADVERDAAQSVAADLAQTGAQTLAVQTDVTDPESVQQLADATLERFGAVHLLCNNAGVFAAGVSWESPLSDYEWVLGVNMWGVLHGIRTFTPIFVEQGVEAHIVNTSSMAGVTSMPFCSAYHMSKHAVVSLSECLYHELSMKAPNVGVSVLCPEGVATRIDRSERNRPQGLAVDGDASAESEIVTAALAETVRTGVAPVVIADRVIAAVEAGQFYILSEEGWREACHSRLDDVRAARNPTLSVPEG